MCYWRHQATENPYIRIGEQDITAHVNFSDLMDAGAQDRLERAEFPDSRRTFSSRQGILDEMQKLASRGDAASMQASAARSRD